MAKFKCKTCGNSWEVEGSLTTRFKTDRIRKFDKNNNPVDDCGDCGEVGEQVKETEGWGAGLSFVDNGTGKRVSK
jgi:uncharacterized Zn finger protein